MTAVIVPAIEILLSESRGIYIPRDFVADGHYDIDW